MSTKMKQNVSIIVVKNDQEKVKDVEEIKLYKARWIMLWVQCMLNVTNNMIFVSYAPSGNYVNEFYQSKNMTNLMSTVFLAVSVPTIIVMICFADRVGLKWIMNGSTFMNTLGAGIKILSTISTFDVNTRFALAIAGQGVTAFANPATLFSNTKLPSLWFPASRRAIATAFCAVSGPLGILIISPLSSSLVKSTSDIQTLNIIVFVPAAFTFLMGLIFIRRSSPPSPPSLSSNTKPLKLSEGLKTVFKNKDYLILALNLGAGLAYFNTYYTTMEATLCGRGYDNVFSSICTSLLIGCGLIGSTIAGVIVDKTKKFEEVFKVCLCLCVLSGLTFNEFAIHPNFEPVIAVAVSGFGFFGIAYYATGMEMSAEITYPASETVSAGIVGLSGQILGVIYITVWGKLTRPLPDYYRNMQKCTFSGQTMDEDNLVESSTIIPQYLFVIVGTVIGMTGVIFFKPKYLRVNLEAKKNPSDEKPAVVENDLSSPDENNVTLEIDKF